MCLHSTLIFNFLLVSAVLANYSSPLYGGVQINSKKNRTFRSVTASFHVPILSGNLSDAVTVAITLGGTTCPTDISLGVSCFVDPKLGCIGWYHVIPNSYHSQLDNLAIHTGDDIIFGVTAPIHNSTTGMHIFYVVPGETPDPIDIAGSVICGREVAWYIGNVPSQDPPGFHPVADFGTMSLTSVTAYSPTGVMYGPLDPGPHHEEYDFNMSLPDGAILASVTRGFHTIAFRYLGNHTQ